jgi:hypothetical protein
VVEEPSLGERKVMEIRFAVPELSVTLVEETLEELKNVIVMVSNIYDTKT